MKALRDMEAKQLEMEKVAGFVAKKVMDKVERIGCRLCFDAFRSGWTVCPCCGHSDNVLRG